MNNFTYHAPTYFSFGRDTEKEVGQLVQQFEGTKVLLHYGGGSIKKNGVYDKVVNSLNAANIPFVELGGVATNPRAALIYEGIELCREEGIDFILAVGGGSAIDSAKAIAFGVPYEGDFWDFFGTGKPITKALPVGAVLTIAAAGSEASDGTVVTNEEKGLKWAASGKVLLPKFSILNPESTCTLPAYQTACGITDIIVHVCERYFTNTQNVDITDRVCEGILKTMVEKGSLLMKNLEDYDLRAEVMWAGMIAHNNICGVGREQDWASHDIEHELSALYDCAHGAGLAVVHPAWMTFVYRQDVMRFAQFAVRIWGCDMDFSNPDKTALEGIEKYKEFLSSIGMPINFEQLGAKERDIPFMAENMGLTDEKKKGSFVQLSTSDVESVLRLAL